MTDSLSLNSQCKSSGRISNDRLMEEGFLEKHRKLMHSHFFKKKLKEISAKQAKVQGNLLKFKHQV